MNNKKKVNNNLQSTSFESIRYISISLKAKHTKTLCYTPN